MLQKYKQKSKEFQKLLKTLTLNMKKRLNKNPNIKRFYSFAKSKLKLSPSLPPLFDVSNVPLKPNFYKAFF